MIQYETVLIYDKRKVMARMSYSIEGKISHFYSKDLNKIPKKDLMTILTIMFGCNSISKCGAAKIFLYQYY